MTTFGFDVPLGDPAAVTEAGKGLNGVARELTDQGHAIAAAARVAGSTGDWGGSAASAYAGYSAHVVSVTSANASACAGAATALLKFAGDLADAQAATRQALAECESAQAEMNSQQDVANTAGQAASSATQRAALAPHPTVAADLQREAAEAERQESAAAAAAEAAQGELQAAQRRGVQAVAAYEHAAATLIGRLQASAHDVRQPPTLRGGAPVPVASSARDNSMAAAILALAANGRGGRSLLADVPAKDRTPGFVLALYEDARKTIEQGSHGVDLLGGVATLFVHEFEDRAGQAGALSKQIVDRLPVGYGAAMRFLEDGAPLPAADMQKFGFAFARAGAAYKVTQEAWVKVLSAAPDLDGPVVGVLKKVPYVGMVLTAAGVALNRTDGKSLAYSVGVPVANLVVGTVTAEGVATLLAASTAIPVVGEVVIAGAAAVAVSYGVDEAGKYVWEHRAAIGHAVDDVGHAAAHVIHDVEPWNWG